MFLPFPESLQTLVVADLKELLRYVPAAPTVKTGASAVLIECRDAETAETVATHKEKSVLCLRAESKTLAKTGKRLRCNP